MAELDDLVTGAQIGRRLGVSTQRAHQLAAHPDFPEPLGRVGNYIIWRWDAVNAWRIKVGRELVPDLTDGLEPPHVDRPRRRA